MAAKCNIVENAYTKLKQLIWGLSCDDNAALDEAILENYVEYLNCPDVNLPICHPSDCVNEPIVLDCGSFTVDSINFEIAPTLPLQFTFSVNSSNFTNGVAPFTCDWQYDTLKLDLISDNGCELILQLKNNVDTVGLSKIIVTVTDALGCIKSKVCHFTDVAIDCSPDFKDCPADKDLTILPYVLGTPNLVFTWNRTAGDVINLTGLIFGTFNVIDWGDGIINTSLIHTYNTTGSYTFKMYNSNANIVEIRNDTAFPSLYKITAVTALPNTINVKLGFDNNSITSLPSLAPITGLIAVAMSKNLLTTFPDISTNTVILFLDVSQNNLNTAAINTLLVAVDGYGTSNGIFTSTGQTVAAPPSGAGITAKNNLIARGWVVLTD